MNRVIVWSVVSLALAAPLPAVAGKSRSKADKMLDSLIECRAISDAAQKLACFESRVDQLKAARDNDKTFLVAEEPREKFSPIDATLASVAEVREGQFILVLSDRSIWQTDEAIRFEPKKGDKVHVGKGALGSYLANIRDERAIHVRPLH